jgi:predicted CXXCH cytochrome family protein
VSQIAPSAVRNRKTLLLAAGVVAIVAIAGLIIARQVDFSRLALQSPPAAVEPAFVGSQACGTCHASQFEAWQGSHHRQAMQPASDATVLGNFDQARFTNAGVTSIFSRDKGRFMVRTDGPDGALHNYQIKYTFGVSPLQQYLIEFPGGRLQALGIAWDSRAAAEGGQRWFALYPDSKAGPASPLHWTAIDQTWNHMCADCHSTNVRKNYDSNTRSYATAYAEIDVGCEACHGPGSDHVTWANQPAESRKADASQGLAIALDKSNAIPWQVDARTGELKRTTSLDNARELELCARCHARRGQIHEDYVHGQPLGDDYRVALLEEDLYFPDGQIKGEVYEYGSFVQSRMFHAGVTCSNCHDPHTSRLRAEGNKLCTQCHVADRYDSPRHHFHPAESAGARCVECHMPTRTYMVIDARRDHSIRVPRPDLSITLGTPNACGNCHGDKTPQWAADNVVKWYGATRIGFQKFGPALQAGRLGAPGAQDSLADLVSDPQQPAITRATALEILAALYPPNGDLASKGSEDGSPLVERAASDTLSNLEPNANARTMLRLLTDPVRAVRIEAADAMAAIGQDALPKEVADEFERAAAEYVNAQVLNADRPESHYDLAMFLARQKDQARAEAELTTALSIDPSFVPAAVNLADLYRELGHDEKAEAVLREAMMHEPDDASLQYALGLLKVRQKQNTQALDLFASAARQDASNARYAYVYAVALDDAGDTHTAIEVLERSLKTNPYDRDSLEAAVAFCHRAGEPEKAKQYAKTLEALGPQHR